MKQLPVGGSRVVALLGAIMRAVVSPEVAGVVALLIGCSLLITGVHLMFGLGPALLVGSVPFLLVAAVIIRGLNRV